MNSILINELRSSRLMLSEQGISQFRSLLTSATESKPVDETSLRAWVEGIVPVNTGEASEEKQVLVLPITGVMTKYARYDFSNRTDWIVPGVDDIAWMIEEADKSDNICGTILLMNTPGGTVQSWIRIEEVLRTRKKPCVAVVDGLCASAGMYVASFCDRIIALNTVCQVGSIGVMATILDTTKAEKQMGIRIIEVYPPESKWKNKSYRDALDDKTSTLIEEELSPLARHFQNTIREMRKIDESVEGVLEGRLFFASDAMLAGLVDDILTYKESISLVGRLASEREEITNSIINP